jgi:hypothetical protein
MSDITSRPVSGLVNWAGNVADMFTHGTGLLKRSAGKCPRRDVVLVMIGSVSGPPSRVRANVNVMHVSMPKNRAGGGREVGFG